MKLCNFIRNFEKISARKLAESENECKQGKLAVVTRKIALRESKTVCSAKRAGFTQRSESIKFHKNLGENGKVIEKIWESGKVCR